MDKKQIQTEIRTFNFDVKAEQNEQHGHFLTGVPILYEQEAEIYDPFIGPYTEKIARGALDNADLKDVRFLIGHNDKSIPLARSRNNNEHSTMQMIVTEKGMQIRVDLDVDNNDDSRKLYSAVQRGDISGMSFSFVADLSQDLWEGDLENHPTRTIRSIKRVYEVSAVAFPAYPQTSLEARSSDAALDSARASLDSAREQRARELAIEKLTHWRHKK